MPYSANPTPEPMPVKAPGRAENLVNGLLGWFFVLAGSAALAATGLIPAYMDTLDLQEIRQQRRLQAQALEAERGRYEKFYVALQEDDPALIERLALTELRLKPVGTEIGDRQPHDPVALVASSSPQAILQAAREQTTQRSIEHQLSQARLEADFEVHIDRPRQTRLVGAATGEHRPWVAGFGAVMLLLGLWPRKNSAAASTP